MQDIATKAKHIKLAILDVDGVLTNGKVYYTDTGQEIKAFHIRDGIGIKMLLEQGIEVAVITGRNSSIVNRRMAELGVKYIYQGQTNKLPTYENIMAELGLTDNEIACIGDDVPDLPLLKRAGLAVCVADAVQAVKQLAHYQTHACGGEGAVREFCELLVQHRQKP